MRFRGITPIVSKNPASALSQFVARGLRFIGGGEGTGKMEHGQSFKTI